MNTLVAMLMALCQVAASIVMAPLLIGLMRTVRARAEGRRGGGVLQPSRDLLKLLRKEPLRADGASSLLVAAPIVLLASSLMLVALVPLVTTGAIPHLPADLFVVVSVFLIGTVALALLGLESGSAFGGMGSSRHMMVAALVEPTMLTAIYALSTPVGTSVLQDIVWARLSEPATVMAPASVLAVVALVIAVIAETGRLPVDNPSTHLELTMIHEAMVLESAGRDLAWLELGSWLRLTVLIGLVVNLVAPWGIASQPGILALVLALAALVTKVAIAGTLIALAEVFLAKVRLFRVPELVAGSFVLAFLAVTASHLVG